MDGPVPTGDVMLCSVILCYIFVCVGRHVTARGMGQ